VPRHQGLPQLSASGDTLNPPQVYDIFDDSGAVLNKTEVLTIVVPESEYSLGGMQEVMCRAVYSTLDLQISYTFVTTLLFDTDGNTSVVVPLTGGWVVCCVVGWMDGWGLDN
jgi:hypothetical protein